MKMLGGVFAAVILAALHMGGPVAHADAFTPAFMADMQAEGPAGGMSPFMTGVRGACAAESHIAMGPVGTDITKNHAPFTCDAMVITIFDKQNSHTMITFAEKAKTKGVIAFAGIMEPDKTTKNMMLVQKVYFEPGKPTYIDEGLCKFFFSGRHMKSVYCGGKIDADGLRTVPSIIFNAEPGQ